VSIDIQSPEYKGIVTNEHSAQPLNAMKLAGAVLAAVNGRIQGTRK